MMLLQGVARITAYVFAFAPTFRHPAQTRQRENMTDKVAMQRLRIKTPHHFYYVNGLLPPCTAPSLCSVESTTGSSP